MHHAYSEILIAGGLHKGYLLFILPGGVSANGRALPEFSITRSSGDRHSFRIADRDVYAGVQAYWLDVDFGKKKKVIVKKRKKTADKKPRSRRPLSEMTVRHYHRCQNFECSITFTMLNSVEKLVTKRAPRDKLPADFIPSDAFPFSLWQEAVKPDPLTPSPPIGGLFDGVRAIEVFNVRQKP